MGESENFTSSHVALTLVFVPKNTQACQSVDHVDQTELVRSDRSLQSVGIAVRRTAVSMRICLTESMNVIASKLASDNGTCSSSTTRAGNPNRISPARFAALAIARKTWTRRAIA
jgi:hypothetical protein